MELVRGRCFRFVVLFFIFSLILKLTNQLNEKILLGNKNILPQHPSPSLHPFLGGLDPFDGRRLRFVPLPNTGTERGRRGFL